ncbi:flagellar assembly protein FliW [Ruminococcaceae bacterium OttesenSCG-928-L11]|nr:flagellar assembly protein FliW [Ruminococcaceae bacterium OttesenSCG-928-L11]
MIVHSAVFGDIDVAEDNIYMMPNGLFGFEGEGRYALITRQEDDVTLMWYQAVDSKVPCFNVFDPFEIIDGYEPMLESFDLKALRTDSPSDLQFLVIAVVPEDITRATVNLKSPLVLNPKEHLARQVIVRNSDYPIKFSLVEDAEQPSPQL